jgi:Ni/Co efflux regulator RcnB
MRKYGFPSGHVMVLLLSAAAWPIEAHAGDGAEPAFPNAGQLSTLFKIDDRDPESSVPTPKQRDGNPLEFGYLLQDFLAKAESATKKQDHRAAIRYYRALALAAPQRATAWSRLCEAYEIVQDRGRGLGACKYAMDREGSELKDYQRFVRIMVRKEGDLSSEEVTLLKQVLAHLDQQSDMAIPAAHLRCESAIKMKDEAALGSCTAALAKVAPEDPKTIVFQWSYAMMRGQRDEAARLIERAKAAGVALDGIERMSKVTAGGRWWSSGGLRAVALGGVVLLALFLLGRRLLTIRRLAGDMAAPPLPRG